ncbi:MAG: HAD hydrolase-like protein [Clostridium sp.]|jgi:phosphoglycolate phosphatase|nr:HAD hydrolase-like protein [Clostridium sp.]
MKPYLLFDLDGTLTDSALGITRCVQYALESFGIHESDMQKLESVIGPPRLDSFQSQYGMSLEQAKQAAEKYRERFGKIGYMENKLYRGIVPMLKLLKKKGLHLIVATSKPEFYATRILEHFKVAQYFEMIVGSSLDHSRTSKEDILAEVFRRFSLKRGSAPKPENFYMIGDRKYDVIGAKAYNIECVAVSYGFGSLDELKDARADYIVSSVNELKDFLLRGGRDPRIPQRLTGRIWMLAFPILIFYAVNQAAQGIMSYVIPFLGLSAPQAVQHYLFVFENEKPVQFTGAGAYILLSISFLVAGLVIRKQAVRAIAWAKRDSRLFHLLPIPRLQYVLLFFATVGAIIGINQLLSLLGLVSPTVLFSTSSSGSDFSTFLIGFLCYCVITPLAEELLFRGSIFHSLRQITSQRNSVLLSAVIFAMYHLNAPQGIYAFLIGVMMAYAYLYFGEFWVPLAIHMFSNLFAYLYNYLEIDPSVLRSWPLCIGFLILGGGSIYLLIMRSTNPLLPFHRKNE